MNMIVPAANNRPKKRSINLIADDPPCAKRACNAPSRSHAWPDTRSPRFMLKLRLRTLQFCPLTAKRVVKYVSIACTIESAVRSRHSCEINDLRSVLLVTKPSSTSTDGTSGALRTTKLADFKGFWCSRVAGFIALTKACAHCTENVLV